jgi:hypothetical protein
MNTPGLFIMGAIVTLIVGGAILLLVYGAILDGRNTRGEPEIPGEFGTGPSPDLATSPVGAADPRPPGRPSA